MKPRAGGEGTRFALEQRPRDSGAHGTSKASEQASGRTHMAHTIRKVGVIGAGQMGSGIAHVCALAGLDVRLNDLSADRIKAGIATINGNMARQVSRQRITEDERQSALKRIGPAATLEAFPDSDLSLPTPPHQAAGNRKL